MATTPGARRATTTAPSRRAAAAAALPLDRPPPTVRTVGSSLSDPVALHRARRAVEAYEVVVQTGDRRCAGTMAAVDVVLVGATGREIVVSIPAVDTTPGAAPHDGSRESLPRASTRAFRVATLLGGSLGRVERVRVARAPLPSVQDLHDDAGWFLDRVTVTALAPTTEELGAEGVSASDCDWLTTDNGGALAVSPADGRPLGAGGARAGAGARAGGGPAGPAGPGPGPAAGAPAADEPERLVRTRLGESVVFPCQAWFGSDAEGVAGGVLERHLLPAVQGREPDDIPLARPLVVRASGLAIPHPDKVSAGGRGANRALVYLTGDGKGRPSATQPLRAWPGPAAAAAPATAAPAAPSAASPPSPPSSLVVKSPPSPPREDPSPSRLSGGPPEGGLRAPLKGKSARGGEGHGGEDAYFWLETDDSLGLGVSDGVYSWRQRGIDSGVLARSLMAEGRRAVERGLDDPLLVLGNAWYRTYHAGVQGSATATYLLLDKRTGLLKSCLLGDSPYVVLSPVRGRAPGESRAAAGGGGRGGRGGGGSGGGSADPGAAAASESPPAYFEHYRSPEQDHQFGYPYQLGHHDSSDRPEDALSRRQRLRPGDVIVLGSDGLFDNVSGDEMCRIVTREQERAELIALTTELRGGRGGGGGVGGRREGEPVVGPAEVARALVAAAHERSLDREACTPYSTAASAEFDMVFSGGKKDDITAVVVVLG